MDLAKDLMSSSGGKIILPTDVIIADKFAEDAKTDTVQSGDVPDGWMVRPASHLTSCARLLLGTTARGRLPMSSSGGGGHSQSVGVCLSRVLTWGKCTNCRAWTLAPTA